MLNSFDRNQKKLQKSLLLHNRTKGLVSRADTLLLTLVFCGEFPNVKCVEEKCKHACPLVAGRRIHAAQAKIKCIFLCSFKSN